MGVGMFRFIEFILRDINWDELEKGGWYGVLEEYKKSMGGKKDFEKMVEDLKKFIVEEFRE